MKKNKWIWMPHAGHLCVGDKCRFHLNTFVGKYIVSTIGDAEEAEFGFERIGSGDKDFYETMVFKARKSECKCCPYEIISGDLECKRYETAEEAYKGHLKLCEKWSKK